MSVHPCIKCHEQAPSCECPDGPHHADGRGDVTDRLRLRCDCGPTLAEFRAWLAARIDAAELLVEQENAARLRGALGLVVAFQAGVR